MNDGLVFDFDAALDLFHKSSLKYVTYPQTKLINAEDYNGIIQSYYASTGTAIFRDSNNKYKQRRVTVREMPCEQFIKLCADGGEIYETYFLK
jgi:hypothetical protein